MPTARGFSRLSIKERIFFPAIITLLLAAALYLEWQIFVVPVQKERAYREALKQQCLNDGHKEYECPGLTP